MSPSEPGGERAGGVLTIDLDAVAANYRSLKRRLDGARCGAVVKADAYGLGMGEVAPALVAAGCREFFVAHVEEGVALRARLPDAAIHVFNGVTAATAATFAEFRLIPVLNDLGQIEAYSAFARGLRRGKDAGEGARRLPASLHIDTGMRRLGLEEREVGVLAASPERLAGVEVGFIMSHLACADVPDHPLNAEQLAAFTGARARLRPALRAPASLANSSGIFLGADYHFDLARPGAALFGLAPRADAPNPMAQVVRLQGKILQVRDVDSPMTVGYGATHRVQAKGRIATVAVGYADGYLHALSNRASAYIGETRVPVVGRISMDLITLDVSDVPPEQAAPGAFAELIGDHHPADALAREAGTIGYEILTGLGRRYHRIYTGGVKGGGEGTAV